MASQVASDRYLDVTRQRFTEGWAGNLALADVLFSETLRTNGVLLGEAGPKRKIQERLAGFPDLTASIEDMLSVIDKIVTRLVWRGTHTGSYGGVEATGKPAGCETSLSSAAKKVRW